MKKKIITLSLIGILLISLLSGCGKSEDKEAAKSTEPDIMQVRSICKLATVECYYHNVAKSEKPAGTGIWHFGEKDRQFWIEYTGTVKLGIDMSKVQMKVNGTDVTVTIPEAEVQQVNVDDDSYNSDSYIFSEDGINKNEITAEDATGAVENARNEMIKTAEFLAKDFPMVRVDLFDINGKIILSEMTFTPGGALIPFEPLSADRKLGDKLDISHLKKDL